MIFPLPYLIFCNKDYEIRYFGEKLLDNKSAWPDIEKVQDCLWWKDIIFLKLLYCQDSFYM